MRQEYYVVIGMIERRDRNDKDRRLVGALYDICQRIALHEVGHSLGLSEHTDHWDISIGPLYSAKEQKALDSSPVVKSLQSFAHGFIHGWYTRETVSDAEKKHGLQNSAG